MRKTSLGLMIPVLLVFGAAAHGADVPCCGNSGSKQPDPDLDTESGKVLWSSACPDGMEQDLRKIQDPVFDHLCPIPQFDGQPRTAQLADLALRWAEAERILLRRHHCGLTSEQIFEQALQRVVAERDAASMARLEKAARRWNRPALITKVAVSRKLMSASRADGPKFEIPLAADPSEIRFMADVLRASRTARTTGDPLVIQGLEAVVATNKRLPPKLRSHLQASIDEAKKVQPAKREGVGSALQKLSAASRQSDVLERHLLRVTFFRQLQSQWCWAAVAKAILLHNGHGRHGQCNLATQFIAQKPGTKHCCFGNGKAPECNQPYYIDRVLRHFRALDRTTAGRPGGARWLAEVKSELKNNRPVVVRIGWPNETGHFIILYGYARHRGFGLLGNEYFYVYDPGRGRLYKSVDEVVRFYQARGRWTHTTFTK